MSKRISKLSRKCKTKNNEATLLNAFDKSTDDFQDEPVSLKAGVKSLRTNVVDEPKDMGTHKVSVVSENIYSVCKKLSAKPHNQCSKVLSSSKVISPNKNLSPKRSNVNEEQRKSKGIQINNEKPTQLKTRRQLRSVSNTNTIIEKPSILSIETVENNVEDAVSTKLPSCPLCARGFKAGQETKRTAHLKECGTSLGIGTEELVKLRRLEVNLFLYLLCNQGNEANLSVAM
jgi:hypothetical protein